MTSAYSKRMHAARERQLAAGIRIVPSGPVVTDQTLYPAALPEGNQAGARAVVETITPERASDLLDTMRSNRKVSELNVARLARAMEQGEWQVTGEAIKVSPDGRLLDGQHRLWAVIMSGVSIETYVIYGIEDAARDVMDTGTARNLGHALSIKGHTNANQLGSLVNLLLSWEAGHEFNTSTFTRASRAEALAYAADHPELNDRLREVSALGLRRRGTSVALLAALNSIFRDISVEDAETFWKTLASGAGLDETDARHQLRRRLTDNALSTRRMPQRDVAALIIKAWNAYREGRPIRLLNFRAGGASPEQFPTPV